MDTSINEAHTEAHEHTFEFVQLEQVEEGFERELDEKDLPVFCKLCGTRIAVLEVDIVPVRKERNGARAYFCCDKCLSIYKEFIVRPKKH